MGESKSNKKPLSATQLRVAKAKIEADLTGGSISAVAPKVFPDAKTPESARVMMHQVLQNLTVQEAIAEAMAQAGLTANTLVDVVKEASQANRVVQLEGDFYETEVPDHTTRLNAVRTAANWLGVGKGEASGNLTLNFINLHNADNESYKLV